MLHFHKFELVGITKDGVVKRRGNAYKRGENMHYKCIFCGKTSEYHTTSYWYYMGEKGNERMEYVDPGP